MAQAAPGIDAAPTDNAATGKEGSESVPLELDPVTVIRLTASLSPQIMRAFERKAAEEARFDFFINNRQAFSYGVGFDFQYDRTSLGADRELERTFQPEFRITKEFYNTSEASIATGYSHVNLPRGHQGDAFVEGRFSVPLFGSREALERSNQKIFQANEVSDAQLDYYREIRRRVEHALESLSWAQRHKEDLTYNKQFLADLEALLEGAQAIEGRDTSADQLTLKAKIESARADVADRRTRFAIALQWLKLNVGLDLETHVKPLEVEFNPFFGETEQQLCHVALETDEEIKTLLNSIINSQAELTLARKGKWDTNLSVSAKKLFSGGGNLDDQRGYEVFTGVAVQTIDPRISRSLERIALANIREYRNAIQARKREIRTQTMEACMSLHTQLAEVRLRTSNLARYWENYSKSLELYDTGLITTYELIEKREEILEEEREIARSRNSVRMNVTRLLASTGRYEEFLAPEDKDLGKQTSGSSQLSE